jgi:hypothetical protein
MAAVSWVVAAVLAVLQQGLLSAAAQPELVGPVRGSPAPAFPNILLAAGPNASAIVPPFRAAAVFGVDPVPAAFKMTRISGASVLPSWAKRQFVPPLFDPLVDTPYDSAQGYEAPPPGYRGVPVAKRLGINVFSACGDQRNPNLFWATGSSALQAVERNSGGGFSVRSVLTAGSFSYIYNFAWCGATSQGLLVVHSQRRSDDI